MKLAKIALGFIVAVSSGCKEGCRLGTGEETGAQVGTPWDVQSGEVIIPSALSCQVPESKLSAGFFTVSFNRDGTLTLKSSSLKSGGDDTIRLVASPGLDPIPVLSLDGETARPLAVTGCRSMAVVENRLYAIDRSGALGRLQGTIRAYRIPQDGSPMEIVVDGSPATRCILASQELVAPDGSLGSPAAGSLQASWVQEDDGQADLDDSPALVRIND